MKNIPRLILMTCLFSLVLFTVNTLAQTVKIYPSTVRVQKGKTKTITAVAYNSSNQPVYNATFSFSTTGSTIASLSSVKVPNGDDIGSDGTAPPNLRTITGLSAGTRTVTATWNGITSSAATIVVDDPAASPTAVIHGDNDSGSGTTITTKAGEAIEVDADSSVGVSKIEWEWGDGDKTTDLLSATHAYLVAGTYSLKLKVTNSLGQSTTSTVTVNVQSQTACTTSNTQTATSVSDLRTKYEALPLSGGRCILLAPGVYVGDLELIARNFTDYVTIGSNAAMPNILNRISPTDTGLVTIRSSSNASSVTPMVIRNGATKLRFVGIKFDPAYAAPNSSDVNTNYYVVQIGEAFNQTNVSQNPTKIIFEHCVIDPHNDVKTPHGVLNDGYKVSIISSWFGNIKTFGAQDSQAVFSINGKGAHVYNNTLLEAASENVIYGGAVPGIQGLTSTNIEFRRCYFPKRLSWKVFETCGSDLCHKVNEKNLFETKNARRLYIEGSIMENHWDALRSQRFALVFKTATAPGSIGEFVPWAISEDIVLENNKVNHIYGGISAGVDNYGLSPFHGLKPSNIIIKNSLFDDLSETRWGYPGASSLDARFLQPNQMEDLQLDHVTMIDKDQTAGEGIVLVTNNNFRLNIKNSIFGLNDYGIIGSSVGTGIRALNPGTGGGNNNCVRDTNATWNLSRNVMPIYGASTSCYPEPTTAPASSQTANFYPQNYSGIGFVDLANGNYALSSSSPYKNQGTDSQDPGADISVLNVRTSCTISGNTATCLGTTPPSGQSPYPGPNPPSLPATIEVENFDSGGQSVAYNDISGTTGSSAYRSSPVEGVDIQARSTASNGYAVFEASAGEWLEYTVNASSSGTYNLGVAYASEFNGGQFHVEIDGVNVTGTMTANSTGNWGTFQTLTKTGVTVSAGTHVIKLVMDTNSPDSCGCVVGNFDKITFIAATASVVWQDIQSTTSTGGSVQHAGTSYYGKAKSQQSISAGQYFEWTFTGQPDVFVGLAPGGSITTSTTLYDLPYYLGGSVREYWMWKEDVNPTAGDLLRIEITSGGTVLYKKNGQLIYTSQTAASGSYQLFFMVQETTGNGINNAIVGNN